MARGTYRDEATLSGWQACYAVDLQGERSVAVRAERVRGKVICSPVDASAIERLGAKGAPVVAVLSERESFTRWVEAPYASVAKASRVFPTLLDIQLPFALDDCLVMFVAKGATPEKSCRGLAVAARRPHVQEKLDACAALGIDPLVLDQSGLALWTQALREHPPATSGELRLVVWLDETHMTLVKGRGSAFESAHTVRVDDTDRARHLAGRSADDGAATWIWSGPAATSERVDALWQTLGEPGQRKIVDAPATFLVRAAATRALLPGPYRCNLRCADMMHAALRQRDRRRGLRSMALALGAALLLAGADVAALWTLHARMHAVEQAVSDELDSLAGYHVTARGRDALRVVQDTVQQRKDTLTPFAVAMDPSLISRWVRVVQTASTNGLTLDTMLLSPERTEISGTSPDWNRCETLLPLLAESGAAPELKRGEALASERIPFTIVQGGAQ